MKQSKFKINKKAELGVLILFIISVFALGLVLALSPITFKNVALALTNYSKITGDSIGATDWNQLETDFLATDGTNSMNGNVITNVGTPLATDLSHAANVSFVMSQMQSGTPDIAHISGTDLRMVCGSTPMGATNWQDYIPELETVYVDIDISAAGFSATPEIITSLGGANNHHTTTGASSIYNITSNGFRVYIRSTVGVIAPAVARITYQWYINWCAVGN